MEVSEEGEGARMRLRKGRSGEVVLGASLVDRRGRVR